MYLVADVVQIYLFPHKCVDLELRWQTVIFIQIRSIHQATARKKKGSRRRDRSAGRHRSDRQHSLRGVLTAASVAPNTPQREERGPPNK